MVGRKNKETPRLPKEPAFEMRVFEEDVREEFRQRETSTERRFTKELLQRVTLRYL